MDDLELFVLSVSTDVWENYPVGFPMNRLAEAFEIAYRGLEASLDVEYNQGVCCKMNNSLINYVLENQAERSIHIEGKFSLEDFVILQSTLRSAIPDKENDEMYRQWRDSLNRISYYTDDHFSSIIHALSWINMCCTEVLRHLSSGLEDISKHKQYELDKLQLCIDISHALMTIFATRRPGGEKIVFVVL
jgi:hypothetical protein